MRMWRSEDALEESALSFYLVGPRHQTQVVRLDRKYNYALSSLLSLYAKKIISKRKQQTPHPRVPWRKP